jgi:DNA-binding transcriptional LysR family regulator
MKIELRLLRHANAVAKYGNFGRAANALHLTQPALSRSIASLEQVLEVKLFERGKRKVVPTAIGKLLLERGENLLKDAADLEEEISSKRGFEIGELTVGCGVYPAERSAGKALGRLIDSYPGLQANLMVSDYQTITRAVLVGGMDLALVDVSAADGESGLNVELVGEHRGAFFVGRTTRF